MRAAEIGAPLDADQNGEDHDHEVRQPNEADEPYGGPEGDRVRGARSIPH